MGAFRSRLDFQYYCHKVAKYNYKLQSRSAKTGMATGLSFYFKVEVVILWISPWKKFELNSMVSSISVEWTSIGFPPREQWKDTHGPIKQKLHALAFIWSPFYALIILWDFPFVGHCYDRIISDRCSKLRSLSFLILFCILLKHVMLIIFNIRLSSFFKRYQQTRAIHLVKPIQWTLPT